MNAVEALIDQVVWETRGEDAQVRSPRWTADEDAFLAEHYMQMSDDALGQALGRSAQACKLRRERYLRLPPRIKHPGFLTTQQVAIVLGVDPHGPVAWVNSGLLPGTLIQFRGQRIIRQVAKPAFYRWALTPEHWIYFQFSRMDDVGFERVTDPKLRRLLEQRQAAWGDAWWHTQRAAAYHHTNTRDILHQIKMGRLPGSIQAINPSGRNPDARWNYWYCRRSEVERLVIPRRRRNGISAR